MTEGDSSGCSDLQLLFLLLVSGQLCVQRSLGSPVLTSGDSEGSFLSVSGSVSQPLEESVRCYYLGRSLKVSESTRLLPFDCHLVRTSQAESCPLMVSHTSLAV